MLTCAATCRSRDKKPDGNKLDGALAGKNNIAEESHLENRMPSEVVVTMTEEEFAVIEYAEKAVKEADTLMKLSSGLPNEYSDYVRAANEAQLATALYGEPEIAAFRSNADRHSGLIR